MPSNEADANAAKTVQGEESAPLATLALALSVEDWKDLGTSDDPDTMATSDVDVLTERMTALLLVRCAALVAPLGRYPDLSTSGICRATLLANKSWPEPLTEKVIGQLREFVKHIVKGYQNTPYHNVEHAYHVVISTNKLMNIFLSRTASSSNHSRKKPPISFGLRNDPLSLFALLFAAVIHDVEHQGVPNRQLALENDKLAIMYNDQSIAENYSIYVGFSELLKNDFSELREVLFPQKEQYLRFRKIVVNLVLTTDIASPERTQLVKSKWKEAFGDPIETIERKMVAAERRASLTGQNVQFQLQQFHPQRRRGTGDSAMSDVSFDPQQQQQRDLDESPSVTPEGSEAGEEPAPTPSSGAMRRLSIEYAAAQPSSNRSQAFMRRRSSMASRGTTATSKYRQRLGILRTVDLSGETLENYSVGGRASLDMTMSTMNNSDKDSAQVMAELEDDRPDDLKATVVMETILQAADVAHNLQGWKQMVKFSDRLYLELRKAFTTGRGSDPQPRWFENQIGFLESYLLPLANRLEDTGVFAGPTESLFAQIVESNRDQWLTEGYDIAQNIIQKGAEVFPDNKN